MGKKRRELVDKFGNDAKSTAHRIRLLRMGAEFLQEGGLHVDRTGCKAEELKALERGEWRLEDVQQHAVRLFAEAEVAHDASTLFERPDAVRIEALLVRLLRRGLEQRRDAPA